MHRRKVAFFAIKSLLYLRDFLGVAFLRTMTFLLVFFEAVTVFRVLLGGATRALVFFGETTRLPVFF